MKSSFTSKAVNQFVKLSSVHYHDMPSTDTHECEHNIEHKKAWGRAGIKALRALAIESVSVLIDPNHNKSGSIDRGYISGFFRNQENTKFVYVRISDSGLMPPVLFRTAEHAKDYHGGANNFAKMTEEGFEKVCAFIFTNLH
jgi:hypothetical protein